MVNPAHGFNDLKLEKMANRPFLERGLAPWAAWEAERTGFGLGFRLATWFPLFLPLLFTADHYADPITELRKNETSNRFKTHLSWYGPKVKILKEKGVNAHCVWHPWNYLGLRSVPLTPGQGTLVFLPHGRKGEEIGLNWSALRKELARLPSWYRPFTIMLGAEDIQDGLHLTVRKELGLPIVTAGLMESQFFPYRFWKILTSYSQTAGASSGSHVFYSIWAGRPHRFLNASEISFSLKAESGGSIDLSPEAMLKRDYPDIETRAKVAEFNNSLSVDNKVPTKDQVAFVAECLRSPEALGRGDLIKLVWLQLFRKIHFLPGLYLSMMVKVLKILARQRA